MAAVEKVESTKDSPPNNRLIGDVVNGLVIVNTLAYIGAIAANANGMTIQLLNVTSIVSDIDNH